MIRTDVLIARDAVMSRTYVLPAPAFRARVACASTADEKTHYENPLIILAIEAAILYNKWRITRASKGVANVSRYTKLDE